MTKTLFGGATLSMHAGPADSVTRMTDQNRSRHALVDRFAIDSDDAAIMLGPIARKFHGILGDSDRIGIRTFLDCYELSARAELAELIETFAQKGQPFHFTARLARSPGACVHGFIAPESAEGGILKWTGTLVMSRDRYGVPLSAARN